MTEPIQRIARAVTALGVVTVVGVIGYLFLGFTLLEAIFQTVITLTTVGYREVRPLTSWGQIYTIGLIITGVGTVLYNLGLLLEAVTEAHLRTYLRRRRMDAGIRKLNGHVIICGYGRVGQAAAAQLRGAGSSVVVMDRDPSRLVELKVWHVVGDVLDDDTLRSAGIERASALIAALDSDAENVYLTLSARALRPDLVIISRARTVDAKEKLVRAGATRAVNPQLIGGRRMATFALDQHVAEFLDGVMHDEGFEARIDQFEVLEHSSIAGLTLDHAAIPTSTGAQVLAIRQPGKRAFVSNPGPEVVIEPGAMLIVFGDEGQLALVQQVIHPPRRDDDTDDTGGTGDTGRT